MEWKWSGKGGQFFSLTPTLKYSHLVVGSVHAEQRCCQWLYYLQNLIPLHLPRQSKQIKCTNLSLLINTNQFCQLNSVECL